MKKYHLLLFLVFTLFSCSNNEESISSSSILLQKVVFYRNAPNENHWNFNNNGLLDNISKPDGTLIEKFIYDANNNVIQDDKYDNGILNMTYNIIYNSNNIITKINNVDYNYNASENKYYYTNGTQIFNCQLNNDKLVTNYSLIDNNPSGTVEDTYQMVYVNDNMTSFQKTTNSVITTLKGFSYGNTIENPIRSGSLAVLKLKSLIEPDFFSNGVSSKLPIETSDFGSSNPITYNYGWLFTPDEKRISMQMIEVFNGSTMINSFVYADYFYSN